MHRSDPTPRLLMKRPEDRRSEVDAREGLIGEFSPFTTLLCTIYNSALLLHDLVCTFIEKIGFWLIDSDLLRNENYRGEKCNMSVVASVDYENMFLFH